MNPFIRIKWQPGWIVSKFLLTEATHYVCCAHSKQWDSEFSCSILHAWFTIPECTILNIICQEITKKMSHRVTFLIKCNITTLTSPLCKLIILRIVGSFWEDMLKIKKKSFQYLHSAATNSEWVFYFVPRRKTLNVSECGWWHIRRYAVLNKTFVKTLFSLCLCGQSSFCTPTVSNGPRNCIQSFLNLKRMHMYLTLRDWCRLCQLTLPLDSGLLWLMEREGCKAPLTKKNETRPTGITSSSTFSSQGVFFFLCKSHMMLWSCFTG